MAVNLKKHFMMMLPKNIFKDFGLILLMMKNLDMNSLKISIGFIRSYYELSTLSTHFATVIARVFASLASDIYFEIHPSVPLSHFSKP